MWYMPYRRVRSAVQIYLAIAIGLTCAAIALRYWPGAVHFDSHQMPQVDITMLFSASISLVGGFATVLGLNLASENDGHLEITWTKPVSREGYALGIFAVDIVAMAACIIATTLCGIVLVDVFAGYQAVTPANGDAVLRTLAFCGLPLCIYAWITALSASLTRNRGLVAGLFWPVLAVLGALHAIPIASIHAVASTLSFINPIALFTTSSSGPAASLWTYLWGWFIAAVLLVSAVLQWRRLQL